MDKFLDLIARISELPKERSEYVTDPYDHRDMNKEVAEYTKKLTPEDIEKIHYAETTGGINLKNPHSSASGQYQLIDSTRKTAEELAKQQGLSQNEANPLRKEAILMKALVNKYENVLENAKNGPFDPNLENIYLMHKNGITGGLNALNAPKTPESVDKFKEVRRLLARKEKNRSPNSVNDKEVSNDILDILKDQ
jgi:muramidase (phage lysozyme)